MDKKKRLILIISIVSLALLVIGGTVAYFAWQGEEVLVNVTVTSGTGSCTLIEDNSTLLAPTNNKRNGRIIRLKANQQMASKASITWNMTVNEINGLQNESFRYELINITTQESYGSGHFANITNVDGSNTITFSNSEETLDYNRDYEFILYLWIDGANFTNPVGMANQNFDFDMSCTLTGSDSSNSNYGTFTRYLNNLYTNNKDTLPVERDGVEYTYASTVSLMNDRLGGNAENSDGGNLRYYGSDPNNYIYFNCSNYNNQTSSTCETWRIIGFFDDKIKIIKNQSIGNLAWDYNKNDNENLTTYTNNWKESSLQELLNGPYYNGNTEGMVKYYSQQQSGPKLEEVITELNMNEIGLKNDETRKMISKSTWYLGGYFSPTSLYANDIYNYERTHIDGTTVYTGNPFTTEQYIGIMYASDYSYATDLSLCEESIANYSADQTNCINTNWLFNSENQWTINQNKNASYFAMQINSSGNINTNGGGGVIVYNPHSVRPVLYLNSNIKFNNGNGTSINPYQIKIN